jgi:hypothetical protein
MICQTKADLVTLPSANASVALETVYGTDFVGQGSAPPPLFVSYSEFPAYSALSAVASVTAGATSVSATAGAETEASAVVAYYFEAVGPSDVTVQVPVAVSGVTFAGLSDPEQVEGFEADAQLLVALYGYTTLLDVQACVSTNGNSIDGLCPFGPLTFGAFDQPISVPSNTPIFVELSGIAVVNA